MVIAAVSLCKSCRQKSVLLTIARLEQTLSELKLAKKRGNLAKKEVAETMRRIRAEYTEYTRQRGSKVQGGGSVGRVIRMFQTASRDTQRRNLADALAPFAQHKRELETSLLDIEERILEVESLLERLRSF